VGLRRLLELLLGVGVVGVAVGVVLERELPVGLLQRLRVGGAIDAEHLVVVTPGHEPEPLGARRAGPSLGTGGRGATGAARAAPGSVLRGAPRPASEARRRRARARASAALRPARLRRPWRPRHPAPRRASRSSCTRAG